MAERSKTGYVPRFPLEVKKPTAADIAGNGSKHDAWVRSLHDAYNATISFREQFQRDKAELDQRLIDQEIGVKGHSKALRALRDDYQKKLDDNPRKAFASVRTYGEKLLKELTAPIEDIARNSRPEIFAQYQDLHGRIVDGETAPDGLTGALSVTAYTIDATAEWIDKEANIESTMAERLAQQAAEKAANNGGGTEGGA